MTSYEHFVAQAVTDFLTEQVYGYEGEFAGKNLFSGTRMPLSQLCIALVVYFTSTNPVSSWARFAWDVQAKAKFTHAGELIWERMKREGIMAGCRLGSISMWANRLNERQKQLQKIKVCRLKPDWIAIQQHYREHLSSCLQNWDDFWFKIQSKLIYLTQQDGAEQDLRERAWKYVKATGKEVASLVPTEDFGYEYMVLHERHRGIAAGQAALFGHIRDNFYSKKRVNPKYLLPALRVREPDWDNPKKGGISLDFTPEPAINGLGMGGTLSGHAIKERDREAQGEPPESHGGLYLHEEKPFFVQEFLKNAQRIFGIKGPIYTPITEPNFYHLMSTLQNGWYLFGDNAMKIYEGRIQCIYDLSISDVFQGFLRRGERGENFCIFVRLDPETDCGGTGDLTTTLWNLEGGLCVISAFEAGKLSTKENWPKVDELADEAHTFLGWHYNADEKRWHTLGLRATQDAADKRLPWQFRAQLQNLPIKWNEKSEARLVEFCEALIPTGLIRLDFTRFQSWVESRRLERLTEVEEYGVEARIHGALIRGGKSVRDLRERIGSFLSLFDLEEVRSLARPLHLSDNNAEAVLTEEVNRIRSYHPTFPDD